MIDNGSEGRARGEDQTEFQEEAFAWHHYVLPRRHRLDDLADLRL